MASSSARREVALRVCCGTTDNGNIVGWALLEGVIEWTITDTPCIIFRPGRDYRTSQATFIVLAVKYVGLDKEAD